MECDVRKQSNGTQLSFGLPQRAYSPAIYPITATDGSTIVLNGHERGLNTLRLYDNNEKSNTSKYRLQELDDEDATHTKLEQWINIDIDSPVTRVAVPSVQSSTNQIPAFLRTSLAVVAACADSSLKLITFPLTLHAQAKQDEVRVTTIYNSGCHQDLITSLALSWSLDERGDIQSSTRARSQDEHLSFLIAAASATGGGLLVYYEVSLKSHLASDEDHDQPPVKQFIEAPLLGSTLAFNHNVHKTTKYPLLLLTSPAHGLVHVLALDDLSSSLKKRRGEDIVRPTADNSAGLSPRIVLSVYAPFHAAPTHTDRKLILDARWLAHGRGIAAVFEGGEWGIWDLETLDRSSNIRSSKTKAKASASFRILGSLAPNSQSKKSTGRPVTDNVAAITPHTRKIRSAALFGNEKASQHAQQHNSWSMGQITVCDHTIAGATNDALILSYNENNFYIATLKPYFDTDQSGGFMGGKSHDKRPQALPSIRLGGERQLCICSRGMPSQRNSEALLGAMNMRPDLIVVTDSRLLLHNNNISLKSALDSSALNLPLRSTGSKETSFISRAANDDILNVDAMDQILESMETAEGNNQQIPTLANNTSVMQMDEHLLSPSIRTAPSAKLEINGQRSSARRKLFG